MHDFPARALALSEGLFLGAFFFGALWWPVHCALSSSPAGRWLEGTLLARTTFAFAEFYGAAGGDWQLMLVIGSSALRTARMPPRPPGGHRPSPGRSAAG
ncbi:MAG TPA: ATP synthase subunit I [Opitutaceae bacterium]|jgi:F1F0 ATPase subunit 2|nr:ATP synthase subunit I [Opitutaceae bacterium]